MADHASRFAKNLSKTAYVFCFDHSKVFCSFTLDIQSYTGIVGAFVVRLNTDFDIILGQNYIKISVQPDRIGARANGGYRPHSSTALHREQERIAKAEAARRETERILREQQAEVDAKKADMVKRDIQREKVSLSGSSMPAARAWCCQHSTNAL